MLHEIQGLAGRIFSIDITGDSRFVVASAQNCMILVFDCENGELVFSKRTESECRLVRFDPLISQDEYTFAAVFESFVLLNVIVFDLSLMSYSVTTSKLGSISTPYRNPLDAVIQNGYLFVSSSTGDICVYSLASGLFRGAVAIPLGPVSIMTAIGETEIAAICSGSKLVCLDLKSDIKVSRIVYECPLQITIQSLSYSRSNRTCVLHRSDGRIITVAPDTTEQVNVIGCTCPNMIRHLLLRDENTAILGGGHFFHSWSLSDGLIEKTIESKKSGNITCMTICETGIACGYDTGTLKLFDLSSFNIMTEIPSCHRGSISAICMSPNFCVTGGNDCVVRVWKGARYVMEFTQSAGQIGGICLSKACEEEVVFYNEKREIFFGNLKTERISKKFNTHKYGNITSMSQVLFNQLDWVVVTGHYDGYIVLWDKDYPNPIKVLDIGPKITCLTVRGSATILFGCMDGELGFIDTSDNVRIHSNPLNNDTLTQIHSFEDNRVIGLNSEGLVMVIDL